MTLYKYAHLAKIAIREIVNYYGEDSPCCYCLKRPICFNLCNDINDFLYDRNGSYIFNTDVKKCYFEDVWKGEENYMDFIQTTMTIMKDGVVDKVIVIE